MRDQWFGYEIKLDKNMQEDKIRITTGTTVDMQGVKFYHKPPEPTIKVDVSREIELDENMPKDKIVIVANVNNEPTAEYFANHLEGETWTEYMLRKERKFHRARLFGVEAKKKPTFLGYVATENIQVESNGTFEALKRHLEPQEFTVKVDVSDEIEKELEKWARSYEGFGKPKASLAKADQIQAATEVDPIREAIAELEKELEKRVRNGAGVEIPGPTAADLKAVDLLEKHLAKRARAITESMGIPPELFEKKKITAMAPVDETHGLLVKSGKRYNIEVENGRGDRIFAAKNVTSLDLSLAEYGPGAYRVFIDEVE